MNRLLSLLLCIPLLPVASLEQSTQLTLMNSMGLAARQNFTIGYLPPEILQVGTNTSACHRISMFKFPCLNSGIAANMTIALLPPVEGQSIERCKIGFTLYSSPSPAGAGAGARQIGTPYLGAFTDIQIPLSQESITVNVSANTWALVAGQDYYFVIQTYTWNMSGTHCLLQLPYGMDTAQPPKYALVLQQGPTDKPCGTTPWTSIKALDGGFVSMAITALPSTGRNVSSSLSESETSTPTPTLTPTLSSLSILPPSPSYSPTISSIPITPTATMTVSPGLMGAPAPAPPASSTSTQLHPGTQGIIAGTVVIVVLAILAFIVQTSDAMRVRRIYLFKVPNSVASVIIQNPVSLQQYGSRV